ncbi:MAG: hypothetical protein HYV45_03220 [Candidatus Moranbacteria bacterium]|nr:hypothetical protein [Candidatus Moranbacteria bacterium]
MKKINGHAIGIILRDLVKRAIIVARRHAANPQVCAKMGYDGAMDDVFTNADREAQAVYLKSLRECLPDAGIVGEEDGVSVGSDTVYFTVDPLDGTKAYIRRQSHGIGTMVALVVKEEIISAYVGDVSTREIFGYRPGSDNVWRLGVDPEYHEKLKGEAESLSKKYILLREREQTYAPLSQKTINSFKSVLIDNGSIGTWAARLWKREVAGLLLPPSWETPWDSTPVVGISQKLGYVFLRPVNNEWEEFSPLITRKKYYRSHDVLVIHKENLAEIFPHTKSLF